MLQDVQQVTIAAFAIIPILIVSFIAFVVVIAVLWKKGKTIEALLAWNSLLLYVIALILVLK